MDAEFNFLTNYESQNLQKDLVACIAKGRELNSEEFKLGVLHEKHAIQTGEQSEQNFRLHADI
jgi:hypothetical protein